MGIVKNIPNTITSMNLLCGILGVIAAFHGRFDYAFFLMLGAAVMDFSDGLSARLLNAYSPIGKELDSLADVVSFGVLPSIMLHQYMVLNSSAPDFVCYIPLCTAIFSGLRLAKFNIDERQSDNFIGLPTPASAMIAGSLIYYVICEPESKFRIASSTSWFLPALSIVLSLLMISEIPMFSMKFKKGIKSGTPIYNLRMTFIALIIVSIIVTLLLELNWSMVILLSFIFYIIINLISACLTKTAMNKRKVL